MPNRVELLWDSSNDKWKAYVYRRDDWQTGNGYDTEMVHHYDEVPCTQRLALVAHNDEVMALLECRDRAGKKALTDLVRQSIEDLRQVLEVRLDEERVRKETKSYTPKTDRELGLLD